MLSVEPLPFLMVKSMCVNGEAVFLKRKESELWIQSFGLNSGFSMCSLALGELLSLTEPWVL